MVRTPAAQTVLVCGLGRVGVQCIKALRGYRVPVRAIDLCPSAEAELELDPASIVKGDFRRTETLREAGVAHCRSIVLVSSDSAANLEGALAARRANPQLRLVVRGEQQNLHTLLAEHLGNLVVYEPNLMAAPAFAFAALDSHVLAHFYVDQRLFQVVDHTISASDALLGLTVDHLHLPGSQVLLHLPRGDSGTRNASAFFGWQPGRLLEVGDRLVVLTSGRPLRSAGDAGGFADTVAELRWGLHRAYRRLRGGLSRPTEVALMGMGTLALLLLVSLVTFMLGPPHLAAGEALRLALILLTGGHLADFFDPFVDLPHNVMWLEIVLTISGTLLTAVLYALLTDRLLTARFQIARRPRPPSRDHVVVAGLGGTGERIASVLQRLHRAVVMVERNRVAPHVLPGMSVVTGSATDRDALSEANLEHAHGIVAATADDLQNVEIALLAHALNPHCRVAVRTFDPRFSENVEFLLPEARVLCVSSLAATAYAAAALGEHVISLFQMHGEPVLVVEYTITADDTLVGRALWEIAEGYAVVPVLHQSQGGRSRVLTPDDATIRLQPSDRLVILATAASLETIERGELRPRDYELQLLGLRPYAEDLQVVGILAHRLGYTLEQARAALAHLPQPVPRPLYGVYAARTQRLLHANGVQTALAPVASAVE